MPSGAEAAPYATPTFALYRIHDTSESNRYKVLLTAVEFDLFSTLGNTTMMAHDLSDILGSHPRGVYDFLDAPVALKLLDRESDGPEGRYWNSPETSAFLVKQSPSYIGGFPEMLNARLFGFTRFEIIPLAGAASAAVAYK